MNDDLYKATKVKAIGILARREHSRSELKVKLSKNGAVSEEIIDQVLDYVIELGYQSDERFTEVYIRYRAGSGYGPLRISRELYAKGIDKEMFSDVLEKEDVDFYELASELFSRKYSQAWVADYKQAQKTYRVMANRGFSSDQIQ